MKLLTKEIENKLPKIDEVSGAEGADLLDLVAQVRFFDPTGSWTWYGIEYDPVAKIFFGYVQGLENEFGDFSLDELQEYNGRLGLGIERDLWYTPKTIREIKVDE